MKQLQKFPKAHHDPKRSDRKRQKSQYLRTARRTKRDSVEYSYKIEAR